MAFKPFTKTTHAYLDYPVAIGLIGLPFLLGLGATSALPVTLSVATGIAAFVLTLLTDHQFGVFRIIPFRLHEAVDALVGVAFIAIPFVLGLSGIDAWYFWLLGGTVMAVLALTDRSPSLETKVAGE